MQLLSSLPTPCDDDLEAVNPWSYGSTNTGEMISSWWNQCMADLVSSDFVPPHEVGLTQTRQRRYHRMATFDLALSTTECRQSIARLEHRIP